MRIEKKGECGKYVDTCRPVAIVSCRNWGGPHETLIESPFALHLGYKTQQTNVVFITLK